jgi:hypothetical protein
MGIEPGAVAVGYVDEEEFGGQGVGGDVDLAEEMDALFQGSADVECFGVVRGHGLNLKRRV